MDDGPIPWRDIVLYAQIAGFDTVVTPAFAQIMRIVDNDWLAYAARKRRKQTEKKIESDVKKSAERGNYARPKGVRRPKGGKRSVG